ncbi:helix-turn-helix transcriptional regulator [Companilactobacillus huachuanensis]|uniref:Helix-turn-helix transcriptional regulator n=1 Tax=Companilactobacillus huachuanensis TaxID=2559914 RepID=A0ABW1RQE1_9LACO|nr:HTH domain-containing protein [Companilactobacillus huachuanensis]
MNKTARINTIMRYINNRQYFTLKELMEQFNISRSTAIRDLNDIQELGMPLTSSVGRDGGYAVLQNKLLPAVQFNNEELKSLFVSFLATMNTQLPYLKNRNTLTEKIMAIASQNQQDDLLTLQELLVFGHTNPANTGLIELVDFAPTMLKTLLNTCLVNRQVEIALKNQRFAAWIRHIFQRENGWYVDAWNLDEKKFQELYIPDIKDVKPLETNDSLTNAELKKIIRSSKPDNNITIQFNRKSILKFQQHPHPTEPLQFLDAFQQSAKLECFVDPADQTRIEDFVGWLMFLGTGAKIISAPVELTNEVKSECATQIDQLP